jgi:hypothetical protein
MPGQNWEAMNFPWVASMAFLLAGGVLTAAAAGALCRVVAFRRTAVRTTATVVESWTQAIKSRPREGVYRASEPRPAARGAAPTIHAHRSRWVRLAFQDAAGSERMVRQHVLGFGYAVGQQVAVLYQPHAPDIVRIDSPLELYGRSVPLACVAALFTIGGALVWWEVVPVTGG